MNVFSFSIRRIYLAAGGGVFTDKNRRGNTRRFY
jgi:hypothetical protein